MPPNQIQAANQPANISLSITPSATFVTGPVMRIENPSQISILMTPPGMWTEISGPPIRVCAPPPPPRCCCCRWRACSPRRAPKSQSGCSRGRGLSGTGRSCGSENSRASPAAGRIAAPFPARTECPRRYHDAMRIANRRGAKGELASADGNFLVEHFAARAGHGNLVAPKADPAHLDADGFAAVKNGRAHEAARRLDGEFLAADHFPVPQIAREDAQAVAAFFGFAAVGIVNLERAFRVLRRKRAEQNAVRADAEVAVADDFHLLRRQRRRQILRVNDDVVVAERVVFGERELHERKDSVLRAKRKTRMKQRASA